MKDAAPGLSRWDTALKCNCGEPVTATDSQCPACGSALGFDPWQRRVLTLLTAREPGWWIESGAKNTHKRTLHYRRCANFESAARCNWLLDANDLKLGGLCRSCRLTRRLPALSQPEDQARWRLIEQAKRTLVASLLALRLPVQSKAEDAERGLAFDLLQATPWGEPTVTAHAGGVITLDVEEADDAAREQRRAVLGEPYRTLLGQLRHDSGHYYWQRLVRDGPWRAPFRQLFGDPRGSHAKALNAYRERGAAVDWQERHVNAYASSHPLEDWSDSWAYFLQMIDTLDAARNFGIDSCRAENRVERMVESDLGVPADACNADFVDLLNEWIEFNAVLNELSRSMGLRDFSPNALSALVVRKLHFVYRVIRSHSEA